MYFEGFKYIAGWSYNGFGNKTYLPIECKLASTAWIVAADIEGSFLTPKFLRSWLTGIPSILRNWLLRSASSTKMLMSTHRDA